MIVLVRFQKIITEQKTRLLLGFLLLILGCDNSKTLLVVQDQTMGTNYSVRIVGDAGQLNYTTIKNVIDSVLVKINRQMSTWDPGSEISKFNRWESLESFKVSKPFFEVVENALRISNQTNGMFDITVYDLMSLWGFGPNPMMGFPDKNSIESVLSYTGFQNIKCDQDRLIKKNHKTKLDLNSIAKGYGVDNVYRTLKNLGYNDIFVEIGGEIRLSGTNEKNKTWSIGLENPPSEVSSEQKPFFGIMKNNECSIATSANYRNIVDADGMVLGHTINPKTGYPIQTDVLSVTVISETCIIADGWATALMAMDYEKGSKIVDDNPDIKAVWVLSNENEKRMIALSDGVIIQNAIYNIKGL